MKRIKRQLKKWSFVGTLLHWTGMATLAVFGVLIALSSFGSPDIMTAYVVRSGSMEPAIGTGSIVFVRAAEHYSGGDIITFRRADSDPAALPITHRVVEVQSEGEAARFVTKGDANNAADAQPVSREEIIGKVLARVPYVGYPVSYARTRAGYVALVAVPAVAIIAGEVSTIHGEVRRRRAAGAGRRVHPAQQRAAAALSTDFATRRRLIPLDSAIPGPL
jgi:signal peptidase